MKLLISLFSIVFLSFNPLNSDHLNTELLRENVVEEQLTFDGYEGGYYFFSDADYQAIVLEATEEDTPYELINGSLEGESFTVIYRVQEKSDQSSSEGIITAVSLKN